MSTLVLAGLEEAAADLNLSFAVLFGSTARGTRRPHSDLDLAVMPDREDGGKDAGLQATLKLSRSLGRGDVDVSWLPEASWLLAWEVAREGRLLYEKDPGRFDAFRRVATMRWADGAVWKLRQKEYVDRFLEGRIGMNRDLVRQMLSQMTQYLRELEPIVTRGEEAFRDDYLLHHTGERLIELLVECAAAVNTEVAQAVKAIPPSDYYSSFYSMLRTGWIDSDTADRLADCARVRNRLVHQYADVQLLVLYSTLRNSVPHWRGYVAQVHRRIEAEQSQTDSS